MSAKKFEKMIECIVNDDEAKAKALFHDIIVEKSRQIYESMMAEDQSMGLIDEIETEENGMDGMMEDEDEFETDEEIGGDYDVEGGDDEEEFDMDSEEDEFGMDDGGMEDGEFGDDELEDRVVDLEDKLDQLMADFEAQMGDDGEEEIDMDSEEEFGDEGGDEEFDDEGMDDEEDGLMENVKLTKVRGLYDSNIGGDDGVQTKSTVAANSGKRGMQGSPVNYDAGAEESQANGPKKPSSYVTKGQKQVEGAAAFKNLPGKNNFTAKGEAAPKPVKTQQSGTNTRSAVPESKRTTKKRI